MFCSHCGDDHEATVTACPRTGRAMDQQGPCGVRIDRYDVHRLIGRGGFGDVYEAAHTYLRQPVALKLLHRATDTPRAQELFLQEAQTAAAIRSPHVVRILDWGKAGDGRPFLVMELLDGETLSQKLRREGPLEADSLVELAIQVLEGLRAAHESGVVHRDIKPGNILLDRASSGRISVKLVDFGVSKRLGPRTADQATSPMAVVGTPGYMAPEQFQVGGAVDERTDLYALCLVMFRALTGHKPFESDDIEELAGQICATPAPTVCSVAPSAPEALGEVIDRGLMRDPDARHQTAKAFIRELRICAGLSPGADEETTRVEWRSAGSSRQGPQGAATRADAPHTQSTLYEPEELFVGRQEDLADLERLFEEGARLVTLVGAGGAGKTRLALRFGTLSQKGESRFNRISFCDVSEARTLARFLEHIARGIGVELANRGGAEAHTKQLADALASRGRSLVIVDNLEQVVGAASPALEAWLKASPETVFLATSRERLGLAGERLHEVGPLSLPEDPLTAEDSDAVRLFLGRARTIRPGYTPTDSDIAVISEIVERLDGLPLAIELAAARMNIFEPAQLLGRLEKRFDVLRGRRRGVAERQATMRGAVDWSWELLDRFEQIALAQCSVFKGGFDLAAAEAVLDVSDAGDHDIVDVLQSLQEKSLLRAVEHSKAGLRFGLYETIRDYAAERLQELGVAETWDRHATYYLEFGEQLRSQVHGRDGLEAVNRLARDQDNLVAVHAHALSSDDGNKPDPTRALRAVLALEDLLFLRGPLEAWTALLDEALDVAGGEQVDPRLRGAGLLGRARAYESAGFLEEAQQHLDQATRLARDHGDRYLEARTLQLQATFASYQGDLAGVDKHLAHALRIQREIGDVSGEGRTLFSHAMIHQVMGRFEEAERFYSEARAKLQVTGDRWVETPTLSNLGMLLLEMGRETEAREVLEEALALSRALRHRRMEGSCLSNLGDVERELGRVDTSLAYCERAIDIFRALGDRRRLALVRGSLASALLERGELQEARQLYLRNLMLLETTGDRITEVIERTGLVAVLADLGEVQDASQMLDLARECMPNVTDPVVPPLIDVATGHLEVARARSARRQGDESALELIQSATHRLEAGAALPPSGRGLYVRRAVRYLRAALARYDRDT